MCECVCLAASVSEITNVSMENVARMTISSQVESYRAHNVESTLIQC